MTFSVCWFVVTYPPHGHSSLFWLIYDTRNRPTSSFIKVFISYGFVIISFYMFIQIIVRELRFYHSYQCTHRRSYKECFVGSQKRSPPYLDATENNLSCLDHIMAWQPLSLVPLFCWFVQQDLTGSKCHWPPMVFLQRRGLTVILAVWFIGCNVQVMTCCVSECTQNHDFPCALVLLVVAIFCDPTHGDVNVQAIYYWSTSHCK